MTIADDLAETRRRHEDKDLMQLLRTVGESGKVRDWPAEPETVEIDDAARAAEMAYRRGVVQGAYFMFWRIHGQPKNGLFDDPKLPGYAYANELCLWREQGHMERYARAEEPPRTETPAYQAPGYATTSVYFIQDTNSGAIKIGKADRPEKRLKELQTGTPYPLTLLGVIGADQSTEADLHERFNHLRIRGEWFRPEPDLLAFVQRWADRPMEATR